MEPANVTAVLFVKDLKRAEAFYCGALSMICTASDEHHSIVNSRGFDLIVHQIPKHIADDITIEQPPIRRVDGAIRLNFPVQSIENTRRLARALGGEVDDQPPSWAEPKANDFLGHDTEGNVFKVSQCP
jgi:catechol 2,3-dioxygenase-like lactoylglutathione lyase family enzyme